MKVYKQLIQIFVTSHKLLKMLGVASLYQWSINNLLFPTTNNHKLYSYINIFENFINTNNKISNEIIRSIITNLNSEPV